MLLSWWVANYLGLSENWPQHHPKIAVLVGEMIMMSHRWITIFSDSYSVTHVLIGMRPQTPSCKRTVDLGRPPLAFQPGHQVQELETTENWILIEISGDASSVNPTGDPMIFNKG